MVYGEPGPPLADHLALLAQRARHDLHAGTARRVVRDRGPGGQGFVVGVGMDEEKTWNLHAHKIDSSGEAAHR